MKIIDSIFCAIAYGSNDAKVYIPFILQLPDLTNNRLTNLFNEKLNMVPEWMFIAYISQMLSNYDFEEESYLDELLQKLAKKYPNGELVLFKIYAKKIGIISLTYKSQDLILIIWKNFSYFIKHFMLIQP
jgi:hypothetical protein